VDTLSYKTISANKATVTKGWVVIDAQNIPLGRLSSIAAAYIRGKYKTNFTPNVDCGDNVIIINAAKVKLTGNKFTDRVYIRHTGYPGGQRFTTPREIMEKDPSKLVERSVKKMLPKNRLGEKLFHNLFVYNGNEHPHAAQQPQSIDIKELI
jgi:large subunit ribosomal protein L13